MLDEINTFILNLRKTIMSIQRKVNALPINTFIFNIIKRTMDIKRKPSVLPINEYNFKNLTPTICRDMHIYNESFNYIFSHDNVLNVAISGPYGAGKSSIIETYKQTHKKIKFMHLSLTHFDQTNEYVKTSDEGVGDKETPINIRIEGQLLNQLIHQINRKNIPQTRFKITKPLSVTLKVLHCLGISFAIGLAGYLIKFEGWQGIAKNISAQWLKNILEWSTKEETFIGALVVLIIILVIYISKVVKMQLESPIFKKLVVKGYQVELFSEKEDSYFDKYLDDILYLFKNADTQVFVFEDIDRYNNNVIFSKLREINRLLNHNVEKPIRFFYLVKDNIFDSKDRSKFFDFIMPIVPILDSSNSYDQFLDFFEGTEFENRLDKTFLERVSWYIDDMRLLKNIYNEFVIYAKRINVTKSILDINKLLAMIIYKNLFPKDFEMLQLNRGFVFTIFANQKYYVEEITKSLNERLSQVKSHIEEAKKEYCKTKVEVDILCLFYDRDLYVDGKKHNQFSSRREFINALHQSSNITINQPRHYAGSQPKTYEQIQNAVAEKNKDYRQRLERVELNNKLPALKREKEELEYKLETIRGYNIARIINQDEIDVFDLNYAIENSNEEYKVPQNHVLSTRKDFYFKLIKYLIRTGMINESYKDYLTYFRAKSITNKDKVFLRSITDNEPLEYDYTLNNPVKVLSKLKQEDFTNKAVCNFDLYSYIMQLKHDRFYYKHAIDTLQRYNLLDFIVGYFLHKEEKPFVEALAKHYPEVLNKYLEINLTSSIEQKCLFINYFMFFCPDSEVINHDIIVRFIEDTPEFLSVTYGFLKQEEKYRIMSDTNIDDFIANMRNLNIKIKAIDGYDPNMKPLILDIYQHNLYAINLEMITLFLEIIYEKEKDNYSKLCTMIYRKPQEQLYNYLQEDVAKRVDLIGIVINYVEVINDEEDIVIRILNDAQLPEDTITEYINKLHTPITYISSIDNIDLWHQLMGQGKLSKNVENIIRYYGKKKSIITDELIQYIDTFTEADFMKVNMDKKAYDSPFPEQIIECEQLSSRFTIKILESIQYTTDEFIIEEVHDKISDLINTSIITMTEWNLEYIKDHYPDYLVFYLHKNIDEYIHDIEDSKKEIADIKKIYKSEAVDIEAKQELMNRLDNPKTIDIANYTPEVNLLLLKTYHSDNQEYLVEVYDKCVPMIQEWIIKNWIEKKWPGEIEVSKQLFIDLFNELPDIGIIDDLLDSNKELIDEEMKTKLFITSANASGYNALIEKKADEASHQADEYKTS